MAAKKKEIRKVARRRAPATALQRVLRVYLPDKAKKTQMIDGRGRPRPPATLVAPSPRRCEGDLMILVIAEQRQGTLSRTTWEAVAAAQQAGGPISVVVLGSGLGNLPDTLAAAAVDEVLTVDLPALAQYTADGYVAALHSAIQESAPDSCSSRTRIRPATSRRPWPPGSSARSSPTSSRSRDRTTAWCTRGRCSRES